MNYPECEKWTKVHDESCHIRNFLDWLDSQEIILCKAEETTTDDFHIPIAERTDNMLYRYFEIDSNKLEKERCAMIEDLQKKNN